MAQKRIGDLLLGMGMITQEQLDQALELKKERKDRLGAILVECGFVTEQQVIEALEYQLGIQYIDLSRTVIPTEMAKVLSKNIARKYAVVPVKVERDTLSLAMVDPLNFMAIEEVKAATRKRVLPMVATAAAVDRAITTLYGSEGAVRAIEEMKRENRAEGETAAAFQTTTLDENVQAAPTVRLVNSIIARAVTERASDIHLEPYADELRVRMRIDGLMRNVLTVPKDLQSSVISRLKVMGGMDISERRVPQDGRANVQVRQREVDIRMSTLPTIHGEKLVLRLLDKNAQMLDKRTLGFTGVDLENYDMLLKNRTGVVLIVGPTGSGKSSTMYTMLNELNTNEVNIVTLEDPVEYHMDGVTQVQINEKIGMTFSAGLRSILRQDPDIIGVGEIRDGETAAIAMRAAITGHMVLSTIHTNSAPAAVDRLLDIGVEPYLIAGAVRGIISQRLVRRICPHCRQAYTPQPEELEALGMPEDEKVVFYKGTGCPNCFHTGYHGRIGVYETMMIDRRLRRAIIDGTDRDSFRQILNEGDFIPMAENCRRLVREGVTTAEEAVRTIHSTDF